MLIGTFTKIEDDYSCVYPRGYIEVDSIQKWPIKPIEKSINLDEVIRNKNQ